MYLPYSMSPLETLEVKYVWPRKFIENKTFTKFYFRVVIWSAVTFPSIVPACQPRVCFSFSEILIRRAFLNFKIGVRTMSPPSIFVHLDQPKKKRKEERMSYHMPITSVMPNRSPDNVSSAKTIVSCHHTCVCMPNNLTKIISCSDYLHLVSDGI